MKMVLMRIELWRNWNSTMFNNSLKVAEEIREGAAKTLTDLNRQGEQIRQTHNVALNIDHDLSIVSFDSGFLLSIIYQIFVY